MIYVVLFGAMIAVQLTLARAVQSRAQSYAVIVVSLFIFSAFRFEVGCDWGGYINQYFVFGGMSLSEAWSNREALWISLYVLQTQFGLPYPWINFVSSLIFFVGAHAMARRQPDPLAFVVLLFPILIINMPMSGIRQGAAIGVMFFAFNAFVDRNIVRFLLLTLAAAGLHSSALVFLLIAPLVNGSFSWKRLLVGSLLAIPGALFLIQGDAAEVANYRYVGSSIDAAGAASRLGLLGITACYFLLFLRRDWIIRFPSDFKLAMIGSLLMLSMLVILPLSSVIADRLAYYLVPIQAVIFARIPFFRFQRSKFLHFAFPYLLLGVAFLIWTSFSVLFNQCYVPYQTWLLGFPEEKVLEF